MADTLTKNKFFHQPTVAELKRREVVETGTQDSLDDIAQRIATLDITRQSLRIRTILFDETSLPPEERKTGWDWRKSLPYINIGHIQARSHEERIALAYGFRKNSEPFDHKIIGAGWWQRGEAQILGLDDTLRGVQALKYELAHLPESWYEMKSPLGVSIYKDTDAAIRKGALAETSVSRSSNAPRADVSLQGVPISRMNDGLTLVAAGMCCKGRKYVAFHYGSPRNTVDKHHVTGALKVAFSEHENGNPWTARRLPILYPTQQMADVKRAVDLAFVDYEIDDIDKKSGEPYMRQVTRPLEGHEREALFTAYARQLIADKKFGDAFSRDSKILKLDWHTGVNS
jgi:hypothetical protein